MCSMVTMAAIFVPLITGRYILALFRFPANLSHDPVNFLVGAVVTIFFGVVIQELVRYLLAKAEVLVLQEVHQSALAAETEGSFVTIDDEMREVTASAVCRVVFKFAASLTASIKQIVANLGVRGIFLISRLAFMWIAAEFALGLLMPSCWVWLPHQTDIAERIAKFSHLPWCSISEFCGSFFEMTNLMKSDILDIASWPILSAFGKAIIPASSSTSGGLLVLLFWVFKVWLLGALAVEAIIFYLIRSNPDPNEVRLPFGVLIASVYPQFQGWVNDIKRGNNYLATTRASVWNVF
jgi:hypothetical protein